MKPRQVLAPLGDVGSAFVLGVGAVVAVLTIASATSWRPLRSPAWSWVVLVLVLSLLVVFALASWWRRRRDRAGGVVDVAGPWQLLAATPALVVVVYALVGFALPAAQRVEWFVNGDHPRHLVLVADLRQTGALSYETAIYPRAWHSVVALVWSLGHAAGPALDLWGLVSVMATMTWLLSGLLALATTTLTAAVTARAGLGTRPAVLVGAVAGALTLWPWFFGNYQALGLESSLVAAVVLAACLREFVVRCGSWAAFVVCLSGVVVIANSWQLLLPVSLLLAAMTAFALVRGRSAGHWLAAGSLVVTAGLVSLPSFAAVVARVGVGHAVDADIVAPVPLGVLGLGLVGVLVLGWIRRRDLALLLALGTMVLPAVTGVVLAWRVGVSPTTYYPGKLLWHTALLTLAPLGALAVLAWRRSATMRLALPRLAARTALAGAGVVVALGALLGPTPALGGSWSTADGAVVRALIAAPDAEQAQVVWSGAGPVSDAVTRILLDAYRPPEGRVGAIQEPTTTAQDCAVLRAAARPTVLTDEPEREVRDRYSCVPDLRIIRPS